MFSIDINPTLILQGKPKNNNYHSMNDNEVPDSDWAVMDYIV